MVKDQDQASNSWLYGGHHPKASGGGGGATDSQSASTSTGGDDGMLLLQPSIRLATPTKTSSTMLTSSSRGKLLFCPTLPSAPLPLSVRAYPCTSKGLSRWTWLIPRIISGFVCTLRVLRTPRLPRKPVVMYLLR